MHTSKEYVCKLLRQRIHKRRNGIGRLLFYSRKLRNYRTIKVNNKKINITLKFNRNSNEIPLKLLPNFEKTYTPHITRLVCFSLKWDATIHLANLLLYICGCIVAMLHSHFETNCTVRNTFQMAIKSTFMFLYHQMQPIFVSIHFSLQCIKFI